MELRIDFYSKTEVAIQIDFAGRYPFPENKASELFLFTCYALRQFSNLGNHVVAKVLAVLMSGYTKNTAIELSNGTYEFPGSGGLGFLMGFQGVHYEFNYNILRDQLFSSVPKHVEFRGAGKKSFLVKLPPFHLSTKGFGFLGFQVNYYAFHSVIALFTHLARRRSNDDAFIEHLAEVAQHCGKAYIAGEIPMGDHVPLANVILKKVGASP